MIYKVQFHNLMTMFGSFIINLLTLGLARFASCAWENFETYNTVFRPYLTSYEMDAGDELVATLSWQGSADLDLFLYKDEKDVLTSTQQIDKQFSGSNNPEIMRYTVNETGRYWLQVSFYSSTEKTSSLSVQINGQEMGTTSATKLDSAIALKLITNTPCEIKMVFNLLYPIELFAPGQDLISGGGPNYQNSTASSPRQMGPISLNESGTWHIVIKNDSSLTNLSLQILTDTNNKCSNFCSQKQHSYGATAWSSTMCRCYPSFSWNKKNQKCQMDCSTISMSNGSASLTSCHCLTEFTWDTFLGLCVIQCGSISNAIGLKPGEIDQCSCETAYAWNQTLAVCAIECGSISNAIGLKPGEIDECSCETTYAWNQTLAVCAIECGSISNAIGLKPGEIDECSCETTYAWNQTLAVCAIECGSISNAIGLKPGEIDECSCETTYAWNQTLAVCAIECGSISNAIGLKPGEIDECSCETTYAWNQTLAVCAIECGSISNAIGLKPGEIDECNCQTKFAWDSSLRFCVIECGSISNAIGLKPGELDECSCQTKFAWDSSLRFCVIECGYISNAIGLKPGEVDECSCETKFAWDQTLKVCVIQCTILDHTLGLAAGSIDSCRCQSPYLWIHADLQCKVPVITISSLEISTSVQSLRCQLVMKMSLHPPLQVFQSINLAPFLSLNGSDLKIMSTKWDADSKKLLLLANYSKEIINQTYELNFVSSVNAKYEFKTHPDSNNTFTVEDSNLLGVFYTQAQFEQVKIIDGLCLALIAVAWGIYIAGLPAKSLAGIESIICIQFCWMARLWNPSALPLHYFRITALKYSTAYNYPFVESFEHEKLNFAYFCSLSTQLFYSNFNVSLIPIYVAAICVIVCKVRESSASKQKLQQMVRLEQSQKHTETEESERQQIQSQMISSIPEDGQQQIIKQANIEHVNESSRQSQDGKCVQRQLQDQTDCNCVQQQQQQRVDHISQPERADASNQQPHEGDQKDLIQILNQRLLNRLEQYDQSVEVLTYVSVALFLNYINCTAMFIAFGNPNSAISIVCLIISFFSFAPPLYFFYTDPFTTGIFLSSFRRDKPLPRFHYVFFMCVMISAVGLLTLDSHPWAALIPLFVLLLETSILRPYQKMSDNIRFAFSICVKIYAVSINVILRYKQTALDTKIILVLVLLGSLMAVVIGSLLMIIREYFLQYQKKQKKQIRETQQNEVIKRQQTDMRASNLLQTIKMSSKEFQEIMDLMLENKEHIFDYYLKERQKMSVYDDIQCTTTRYCEAMRQELLARKPVDVGAVQESCKKSAFRFNRTFAFSKMKRDFENIYGQFEKQEENAAQKKKREKKEKEDREEHERQLKKMQKQEQRRKLSVTKFSKLSTDAQDRVIRLIKDNETSIKLEHAFRQNKIHSQPVDEEKMKAYQLINMNWKRNQRKVYH